MHEQAREELAVLVQLFRQRWVRAVLLPLCPGKGRSGAKWVLFTWEWLLKSELGDKSYFLFFSFACRRNKEKTCEALGGKERDPLSNPYARIRRKLNVMVISSRAVFQMRSDCFKESREKKLFGGLLWPCCSCMAV